MHGLHVLTRCDLHLILKVMECTWLSKHNYDASLVTIVALYHDAFSKNIWMVLAFIGLGHDDSSKNIMGVMLTWL